MAAPIRSKMKTYLFQFANEHTDFKIAELKSLLSLFNYDVEIPSTDSKNPFLMLELPSEECARHIASRSVLVRSVSEIWAHGTNYEDLYTALRGIPSAFLKPYIETKETFRFQVISFNKTLTPKEKLNIIQNLPTDVLDFHGKVDLKNAAHSYHLVEYYGPCGSIPAEQPIHIYFAKWIANGQRDDIRHFHLKKRKFIANTSMDAGLSMVMANLGKVDKNMLLFDPFVGSGSLLVAAAHYGAYVMGTDIDYLLLHARAKPSRCDETVRASDESIWSNLRQYGTEHRYIDSLVGDSSRDNMWREQTWFDAIITDPPYGIREGAKKVAARTEQQYKNDINSADQHVSKREEYHLSDIFNDLLNFSAKYLNLNGRLVYWFPVSIKEYKEENIPSHPCLRLVHNCEQPLNTRLSRRLITMEKILEYADSIPNAQTKVDHFEDSTFREMYFSESKLNKERTVNTSKERNVKTSDKIKDINTNNT